MARITHNLTGTPEHYVWMRMKSRCYNQNFNQYKNYGGRGIVVCDRWKNSFQTFLNDMGKRPDGFQLDRINNNGNYSPENCRWATRKQQANNRTNSKMVSFNGLTLTLAQWSEKTGLNYFVLWERLKKGWSVERVLTQSVKFRKHA